MTAAVSAASIAAAVRSGRRSAKDVVRETLDKISAENDAINAFTAVRREGALAEAAAADEAIAAGRDPGPLAGAPFAVKNLYDVAGLATIAGARIDRDRAPATRDAALARRLKAAGAVLVGALNMDEYAFGFSTENTHYGPTRNPTTSRASPAALPAARLRPSPPRSFLCRSARTPTARYACRRRLPAYSDCARPLDA